MNHLCFADDLFLFSHGNYESVKGFGDALKHFEVTSGLRVNDSKSSVYFARVPDQMKRKILQTLNFKEATLPVTYLGVHLVSTVIKKSHCMSLIDKITTRVGNWVAKYLSYAGRVQLINSVLRSLHVY